MSPTGIDIRVARGNDDMEIARKMFREYQQWLGVDLCFQDFDDELAGLPGSYAPPKGEIFIAAEGDKVAGIIAVRPINGERSEMKRLYVRDNWKGRGLGRHLAELVVEYAKQQGYRSMVLDTLPHLHAAIGIYEKMGFEKIPAYYENPIPGVAYMEKIL